MSREYVLNSFRAPVNLQIDYAKELNEQQFAAVTAEPGPALVIAGAGSGKTRTLTYRVAFLLEQGIPPERILLLTFTNKASKEMMRRVNELLGSELSSLWGGTFHSVGHRILRRNAEKLGYRKDFTIVDAEDAKDLVDAVLGESNIDVKETRFPKADVLGSMFSMAVNTRKSIPEALAQYYEHFAHLAPQIAGLHAKYQERKRASNVMDYDDLLVLWMKLLQEHEDVRRQYQRQFQFVLVDEYQDTNLIQSEIIDALAGQHNNIMAVGDDSQSIYSWRGANFRNILDFPKRYPGAKVYKIEVNYRSTPEILQLANAAIKANTEQFEKSLEPARKSGIKPVLVTCGDAGEQAGFVAQRALELREEGVNLNDMCVLYRSHFHAMELQMELTKRNIPFSITSGIRFFEQAHIKDVSSWLRLVANPQDELAFKRLVQMMPGVGGKAADKLWRIFQANHMALLPGEKLPLATALQQAAKDAPKKAALDWAQFTATISQMETEPIREQPANMIRIVLQAGYEDYLKREFANFKQRLEDVEQLATFALQFENTSEFLTQLALLSNVEAEADKSAEDDEDRLRLSTIHQAKGLEYDVVFLIMLCDGLFPSARSLDRPESEEEERRLFYVAVTRAKNELYLSYPLIRTAQGYGEAMQQPSRFLGELPKDLRDEWTLRSYSSYY